MNTVFLFILVIITASEFCCVESLDLKAEIKRQSENPFCGIIKVAPNVNVSWVQSTKTWYFAYWTRFEFLMVSTAYLSAEEFTNMSEEDALKDICFRMDWNTGDSFGYGIQLPSNWTSLLKIHYNPIRHGVMDWECDGKYGLTTYIVMTDNKTFVVGVDMFPDGTRGGFVMTPDPDESKFSKEQVLQWKSKLEEVGLDEGDFFHAPLECNKKNEQEFGKYTGSRSN